MVHIFPSLGLGATGHKVHQPMDVSEFQEHLETHKALLEDGSISLLVLPILCLNSFPTGYLPGRCSAVDQSLAMFHELFIKKITVCTDKLVKTHSKFIPTIIKH